MSRKSARIFVAVVLLLTALNWFYARKARAAAPQLTFGQPACRSFVPPEWGDYKGSSEHYGVVFQGQRWHASLRHKCSLRSDPADCPRNPTRLPKQLKKPSSRRCSMSCANCG